MKKTSVRNIETNIINARIRRNPKTASSFGMIGFHVNDNTVIYLVRIKLSAGMSTTLVNACKSGKISKLHALKKLTNSAKLSFHSVRFKNAKHKHGLIKRLEIKFVKRSLKVRERLVLQIQKRKQKEN